MVVGRWFIIEQPGGPRVLFGILKRRNEARQVLDRERHSCQG